MGYEITVLSWGNGWDVYFPQLIGLRGFTDTLANLEQTASAMLETYKTTEAAAGRTLPEPKSGHQFWPNATSDDFAVRGWRT